MHSALKAALIPWYAWRVASLFCSKKCQAVITMIAQKLGSEDAALYRFTHPAAAPPTPPATPQPALSNTVIERDPSLHQPQHVSGQHRPTSDVTAQHSMQQAERQQAPVTIPSKEGMSVGTRKRSKAGLQYAAGSAKVPIMLAEIKVCPLHACMAFIISISCSPCVYCQLLIHG